MTLTLPGIDGPHAGAELVVAGAPAVAAEVAVVLLHGRGGTAAGILQLADEFTRSGVTLLAPQARRSVWVPTRYDAPLDANEPALTSAVDCISRTIDVAAAIDIDYRDIVLVGVSQGGSVLAEFCCRHPRRFGGVFVASAALPGEAVASRTVAGTLDGAPVELASAAGDPLVAVDRVRETGAVLEAGGADVDVRIDPGDGHGLSTDTSDEIDQRLGQLLSRSTT